jgi:copper(I)-binding protein
MRFAQALAGTVFSLFAVHGAMAGDYKVGNIELDDLWVRASVPGQVNGAGYLEIDNKSNAQDKLIAVESAASKRIELHTIINENGVAKMREVQGGIPISAQGKTNLKPGGYHVMFIQLNGPFKVGEKVDAVMKFEKAGSVNVQFKVKPATYNPGTTGEHGMPMQGGMKH